MQIGTTSEPARWELYKLLAEPLRLRLLALAGVEELAIGELAELLRESQPNVSRHVKPLKRAGLLVVRRQGTRALVRLKAHAQRDPVVADALASGRSLVMEDGSLARVAALIADRDRPTRAFFERAAEEGVSGLAPELPAYLTALAPLLPRRKLAIDVGTGTGRLLDLLAPIYDHVLAVDRAPVQLEHARQRLERAGYAHVELVEGGFDSPELRQRAEALGGADAIFASRVLHHAPRPAEALASMARPLAPGGALVVIDYLAHHDERLRERQADLWLGFEADELLKLAEQAGLEGAAVHQIPSTRCGGGPDGHLDWQVLVARRPAG